ncbi:excalibur calcium-binding domain-containing protein [Streptomyces thermocarboxydus]|uniref:excalibur calcium-binding domain-containing protein n=1 Tax=Streptomyces TaxID=1883 RepID=UPI0020C6C48E|nr:excalibur calcium-binding domain-containing protein [Streptomyces sp. AC04842]MDN3284745.1 excalibur calcium-binding domain-containing protein [Streptomyces thermocarboxydus]
MTNPYTTGGRTAPKWARKRYVLPALFLAFCMGIAASGEDSSAKGDAKPLAAKAQPSATVTATVTATPPAEAEPAPTVTVTETETARVKVKVTKTVTAEPAEDDYSGGGGGGGSVYYENCSAARAAGAAPVHIGDPGYGSHLDRDGDGTGCE